MATGTAVVALSRPAVRNDGLPVHAVLGGVGMSPTCADDRRSRSGRCRGRECPDDVSQSSSTSPSHRRVVVFAALPRRASGRGVMSVGFRVNEISTETSMKARCSALHPLKPREKSAQCHSQPAARSEADLALPKEEEIQARMQDLSDSLASIDADFIRKLPNDLRVDVQDAAFILSNGQVALQCGEQSGTALTELAAALEVGDQTSAVKAASSLTAAVEILERGCGERNAVGKRLKAAGRQLTSTGSYGEGELQKIGKALVLAGDIVSEGCAEVASVKSTSSRTLKFGTLEVEITPGRAFTGVFAATSFGAVSLWLTRGLQDINDGSITYANDNALALALSLRATLLAMGYSSTVLSGFVAIGLVALGLQLGKSDEADDINKK